MTKRWKQAKNCPKKDTPARRKGSGNEGKKNLEK